MAFAAHGEAAAYTARYLRRTTLAVRCLIFRDGMHLQHLPLPFRNMERASLPFISLQKNRIVVRFAVHILPGKQCVLTRPNPVQGEVAPLIGDGVVITI